MLDTSVPRMMLWYRCAPLIGCGRLARVSGYAVSALPNDPVSRPPDAITAIMEAASGLLVPSEGDYPLEPFCGHGPHPLTPEALLALLGLPSDTPIEIRTLDSFLSPLATEYEWFDPTQRTAAARFADLRDLIATTLADLVVYRVGRISITVIIAGVDAVGNTVGLRTTLIET
jgi:Nuclease A inhibitor-like protein